MAELWQTYGSWIIYGAAFIVMILLHGRMHSGHSHVEQVEPPAASAQDDPQVTTAQAGPGTPQASHAHGEPRHSHARHRGGCC